MKKYLCLLLVAGLMISSLFVQTGKADWHSVTLEEIESMTMTQLLALIKEMDAEIEMKTRDLRKIFAEGLVEDYTPDHKGYLLFAQHYPNTVRNIEEKVAQALASGPKATPPSITRELRDLPWLLFDGINVTDAVHESFLRRDISQQHPDWSVDHVNFHVEHLSDEINRQSAQNQGAFARWFTDKRIKIEAARESAERIDQMRAHREENCPLPPNLRGAPNGMPAPSHILGTPGGPGNRQRGGGIDNWPPVSNGGTVCVRISDIIYGPDGEVVSVTYVPVPCS